MTFLSLAIEKSCLTQQKDLLEFEEMILVNNYNNVTSQLSTYLSEDGASSSDNTACQLEAQQEYYDSKKTAIEAQLETINAEIDSYEKAVTNNIKSECKLSLSV